MYGGRGEVLPDGDGDEPLFVLNRKTDRASMVHTAECTAIVHQIEDHPAGDSVTGTIEWAAANPHLTGHEAEATRPSHRLAHSAEYVTRGELATSAALYRRCRICAPDVPEPSELGGDPWRSVTCRSLDQRHIGRVFADLGVLREVRISEQGYTLLGEDSTSSQNPPDAVLKYRN